MSEALKFVMAGHVDHGKSTLIGRMLADTDSLMEGAMEEVEEKCREKGVDFEYAFLLDALQEEQEQGVTIDITNIEFSTDERHYTIIDAPGHREFLKNMVSGASNAEAALLLIDAEEGVQEQTRKHAYLLNLLGIDQVFVVINKMDLVDYDEERFEEIEEEIMQYLENLDIYPDKCIPISAKKGDNVTEPSDNLDWFDGDTVLEAIDDFTKEEELHDKPLRFPIQDVYKFDDRRIIAGRVESGTIEEGDEIVMSPSGKKTSVKSLEYWREEDEKDNASAGECIGITIPDKYFIKRGEMISHLEDMPVSSNLFTANVFWMGEKELEEGKEYKLKLNTQEVKCEVYTVNKVIDSETLENIPSRDSLERYDVGNVVIKTKNPITFDPFKKIGTTGRFVLVEDKVVKGGGIIEKEPEELQSRGEIETESKHISPKTRLVDLEEREERYGHKGKVVWITGLPGSGKNQIAQHLERELFDEGKNVYYINASNIRLSLSSDLDFSEEARREHTRRVAELANIMMNAGYIVVVSIVSPYKEDRARARDLIGSENYLEIFIDTPLEICQEQDPHGIYSKAEAGEIDNVPGVDIDYEKSDYMISTIPINDKDFSVEDKVKQVADQVEKNV